MTFRVRDLMLHVLPANDLDALHLGPCQPITGGEPPKPRPKPVPKPGPKPQCQPITATGPVEFDEGQELPSIALLRQQLRDALSAAGAAQR